MPTSRMIDLSASRSRAMNSRLRILKRALREEMSAIEAPKRQEIEEEMIRRYPQEVQDALAKRPEDRSSFEWLMFHKAKQYLDPKSHQYVASSMAVVAALKPEQKEKWK